jgi:hypothetical protein
MCIPVVDKNCDPIGDAASNAAKSFLETLAEETMAANAQLVKTIATGWLAVPSTEVSSQTGAVAYLRGYTSWIVAAIAVGALLASAGKLAIERNGREAGALGRGLAWLVVLTGAGIPAIVLLTEIGDAYSSWIVNKAADGDFGARLTVMGTLGSATGLGVMLMLGIAVLVFMATLAQVLLLIGRSAGLVLLTGLLPVAAAAGISGGGRAMRDRYLSWLLAFILYKPAAATVYAAAFWLIGKGTDLMSVLTGMVAFCMAVVALPALMRLITPAVSTITAGGSGMAAAGMSAGGQLASGAMQLSQAKSGGGGGGGTADSAPTGSGSAPAPATPAMGAGGGGAPSGGGASTGPASSTGAGASSAGTSSGAAASSGATSAGAGSAGSAAAGAGASGAAAAGPAAAGVMVAKAGYDAGQAAMKQAGDGGATGATGDGH